MSIKKEIVDQNLKADGPTLKRNQLFKEELFSFNDSGLESRILKLCGDNKSNLLLFKKSIFYTETCKEESSYYEWNTSLKGHNFTTGKFDIELGLHYNKDVPDISELQPGRYKLILKYYNPHKARKNKIYGCVDTQSLEFTVGNGATASSRGGLQGNRQDAPSGVQNLAMLDTIGQTVGKVGEILNKSLEIHQNTLQYSDKIKAEAYNEGYERRKHEEEQERTVRELKERLERLENAPAAKAQGTGEENFIVGFLKKMGIIPDIDFNALSPEQIAELLANMGKQAEAQK